MKPVLIEVVAPMLSSVEMGCHGCSCVFGALGIKTKDRAACEESYPDEWKEAVNYLGNWIGNLSRLYRHRIHIRIIDAQSPLGLWKQLRHRVLRFPAFIVNRKKTYVGWNPSDLESVIDEEVRNTV